MVVKSKRIIGISVLSITALLILFFLALMIGKYHISFPNFFKAIFINDPNLEIQRSIILNLRLPRTLMACFVGIGLSLSGLLYQQIFRNEIVSPDILGVSTGSSVGAALGILLGLSATLVSLFSFLAGLITVALTIIVSRIFKNGASITLVLAGIIVGGFMSSLLSIIKFFADPETTLASITYWLMGSFADAKYNQIIILSIVVILCIVIIILISHPINVISLGRDITQTKGLNYSFYAGLVILVSTILTAISVCFCGTISWVGLVVPHISKNIVGNDSKKTIPLCITFGGSFMIIVDILSRTFTDVEIPLSGVTGFIGTIIFIFILLFKRKRK